MKLEDGLVIVLPRDEAKAFFGFREDGPRLQFIQELVQNDAIPKASCDGQWQAIHDYLSQLEVDQSFLGQVILGGRPLHQGDDYHVCLVRPDVVGFIQQQLQSLNFENVPFREALTSVVTMFEQAANARGATIFVAKRS